MALKSSAVVGIALIGFVAIFALGQTPAAAPAAPEGSAKATAAQIDSVIELVKAGLSEGLIIRSLQKNNKPANLTMADMVKLKNAGVSENIISIMLDPAGALAMPATANPKQDAAKTPPTTPVPLAATPAVPGGSDRPSEQQARVVFAKSFQGLANLGVKLMEFRKVNAESLEVAGQKVYVWHFLAIEKLPTGLAWAAPGLVDRGGIVKDPGKGQPIIFGGGNTQSVPEGTIALRRGKITFRMTENGWVSADLPDTADDALCGKVQLDECIKQVGYDKLN
jgi:hypothetical protein